MPHIHEKYDFTVGCMIVHEGKLLLVNHPRYNVWLCPGGHVELDEDPEEALYREIQEETGLEVEIIADRPSVKTKDNSKFIFIPAYISVHDANPPHKHIGLTYYARAKSVNNVKSDEHTDTKWFTAEDLDNVKYEMPDEIRHFGKEAIKKISSL